MRRVAICLPGGWSTRIGAVERPSSPNPVLLRDGAGDGFTRGTSESWSMLMRSKHLLLAIVVALGLSACLGEPTAPDRGTKPEPPPKSGTTSVQAY